MIRYFIRMLGVHARSGRTLYALTVGGVALGVASVLSIQIINANALGAFEGSLRAVSGDSRLTVLGVTPSFDERRLADVLADRAVTRAHPLIRTDVLLPDPDGGEGLYLEIVGADLLEAARFPWAAGGPRGLEPFGEGWAAVSPELAQARGWEIGDRFELLSGSRRVALEVGAIVDFRQLTPLASTRLVVMDIGAAQIAFGEPGRIDQIDIELADGADVAAARERLTGRLGPGVRLTTPEERRAAAGDLLAAFRLNLTAMSLISVLVGGFLVYTSTLAALSRRRREFGVLRAEGATRGQIFALILAEVGWLGLVGTAVGLPLGWLAAELNVGVVSATISNLYLLEEIERLRWGAPLVLLAVGVGTGGALLAAVGPAAEIAREDPRALLSTFTLREAARDRRGLRLVGLVGIALVTGAALWLFGDRPEVGFVLALATLLTIPLVGPGLTRLLLDRIAPRRLGVGYGLRATGKELHTTGNAIAALAVAVCMLVGLTIMIGSFRRTLEIWVGETLRADVYVTTPSWRRARADAWLDPEVLAAIESIPGLERAYRLRQLSVASDGVAIRLSGSDITAAGDRAGFALVEGRLAEALRAVERDGAVIVTEPLARKRGLGVGDRLDVRTPTGTARLPIAGVAYDYSSDGGGGIVHLETLERLYGPGQPSNLALVLEPGVEAERLIDRIRARLPDVPLELRSNRRIRGEIFRIFDQTFAVTRLLQLMGLVIAVAGVALTLLILARERVAELALYGALGATRRQLFALFVGKGLGITLVALLLGLAGGVALAAVLVFRINRDFFGWTIALYWPWAELALQLATIVVVSVAASLYPALLATRTPATGLSREDR